MPVFTSANATEVLTFLINKDIVKLKDTEEGFRKRFPRGVHFQTLCHLSAHLQEVGLCSRLDGDGILGSVPLLLTSPDEQERSLLGFEERLAALYLFRALYTSTPIEGNPFRTFLVKVSSARQAIRAEAKHRPPMQLPWAGCTGRVQEGGGAQLCAATIGG